MSDSNPNLSANQPPTPPATLPKLNPVAAMFALGSEVRWPIIQMLADGRSMNASEVAAALGRDLDGIGKQLKVLRDAGVVEARPGEDRRQTHYYIPAARRPEPGVLDYGFCVLKLTKA